MTWTQSELPVIAAPMAGGATTPALVAAAADAGGFGFLAGGYKTPDAVAAEMAGLVGAGVAFGVNLFVPGGPSITSADFRRYAEELADEGQPYGLDLATAPLVDDDDHWQAKLDLLLQDPVPFVSFTFGLPEPSVVAALRRAGSQVLVTVTTAAEARNAEASGVDGLIVQSTEAGGHSGTHTPDQPVPAVPLPELVRQLKAATNLPLIAAGGIGDPMRVREVLRAGASAAMIGTLLLRTDESGTSEVHREAIATAGPDQTVITRAFTGRPARGIRNGFITRHEATAPLGYPAIHHLTRPLRAAATAARNPDQVHLWAGTAYRQARPVRATDVITELATAL